MAHSRLFGGALLIASIGLASIGVAVNTSAQTIAPDLPAQSGVTVTPDSEPLDLTALKPGKTPANLVTANSISRTELTVPSLWWLRDQLADQDVYGNKLLENWLAYPASGNRPGRVDLVMNYQLWSLLDYLDRYAFIHIFGKAARDYGYNVRVFDGQATLLGASTCDFSTINLNSLQSRQLSERIEGVDRPTLSTSLPTDQADTIACSILLDSSGKAGLRGGARQLPGAGSAKALDTARP